MVIANPVRLFHITAIANFPGIFAARALFSKSAGNLFGIAYQNIAHAGAQRARLIRTVPDPPGGVVHDFVPFYFAPRSPMLYALNGEKVVGIGDIHYPMTSKHDVILVFSENCDYACKNSLTQHVKNATSELVLS